MGLMQVYVFLSSDLATVCYLREFVTFFNYSISNSIIICKIYDGHIKKSVTFCLSLFPYLNIQSICYFSRACFSEVQVSNKSGLIKDTNNKAVWKERLKIFGDRNKLFINNGNRTEWSRIDLIDLSGSNVHCGSCSHERIQYGVAFVWSGKFKGKLRSRKILP